MNKLKAFVIPVLLLIVFWSIVAIAIDTSFPPPPPAKNEDGTYNWDVILATAHPDDPYRGQYMEYEDALATVAPIATMYPDPTSCKGMLCN